MTYAGLCRDPSLSSTESAQKEIIDSKPWHTRPPSLSRQQELPDSCMCDCRGAITHIDTLNRSGCLFYRNRITLLNSGPIMDVR